MTNSDREKSLRAHLPDATVDEHTAFRCGWNSALLAAGASESAIYDAMVQCCEIHGYEIEPEVIDMLSRSVVSAATKASGRR